MGNVAIGRAACRHLVAVLLLCLMLGGCVGGQGEGTIREEGQIRKVQSPADFRSVRKAMMWWQKSYSQNVWRVGDGIYIDAGYGENAALYRLDVQGNAATMPGIAVAPMFRSGSRLYFEVGWTDVTGEESPYCTILSEDIGGGNRKVVYREKNAIRFLGIDDEYLFIERTRDKPQGRWDIGVFCISRTTGEERKVVGGSVLTGSNYRDDGLWFIYPDDVYADFPEHDGKVYRYLPMDGVLEERGDFAALAACYPGNADGGWLYYFMPGDAEGMSEEGALRRVSIGSGLEEEVGRFEGMGDFVVREGVLHYSTRQPAPGSDEDLYDIYVQDADGRSAARKVAEGVFTEVFDLFEGWAYFERRDGERGVYSVYRARVDGTEEQLLLETESPDYEDEEGLWHPGFLWPEE